VTAVARRDAFMVFFPPAEALLIAGLIRGLAKS